MKSNKSREYQSFRTENKSQDFILRKKAGKAKIKKFLYVKENELKKLFNHYYYQNKKLETRIKQIRFNLDKREKEISGLKELSNHRSNLEYLDQSNKAHLFNLFENENPNTMKEKIKKS